MNLKKLTSQKFSFKIICDHSSKNQPPILFNFCTSKNIISIRDESWIMTLIGQSRKVVRESLFLTVFETKFAFQIRTSTAGKIFVSKFATTAGDLITPSALFIARTPSCPWSPMWTWVLFTLLNFFILTRLTTQISNITMLANSMSLLNTTTTAFGTKCPTVPFWVMRTLVKETGFCSFYFFIPWTSDITHFSIEAFFHWSKNELWY